MIHTSDLIGKTIVSAAGTYVGEVYDIGVEQSTWTLSFLYVKLSDNAIKTLGLKKTLHRARIKLPTSVIAHVGVIIKLTKSLEDLKQQLEVTID
jgi:sporulation protein YlmC with PRC-barrel domain